MICNKLYYNIMIIMITMLLIIIIMETLHLHYIITPITLKLDLMGKDINNNNNNVNNNNN